MARNHGSTRSKELLWSSPCRTNTGTFAILHDNICTFECRVSPDTHAFLSGYPSVGESPGPGGNFGVHLLIARNLTPYLNNTIGTRRKTVERMARTVPAHCSSSPKYMLLANAENATAASERTDVLMAIAELACGASGCQEWSSWMITKGTYRKLQRCIHSLAEI